MSHDTDNKFYNPLKRFQSYSYHHILIACDSTQTAALIEKQGSITELQRSRANQTGENADNKYIARSAHPDHPDNKFVVLIDGLVDSDFYILGAEWETVIAPSTPEQHAMMNVQGKLEIFEPFGVAFMERLVNLGSELGTDTSGILFMLKTVFVGRDDSIPNSRVELVDNVLPFLFVLTNITSSIDETGASYEMNVVGAQNGFAKLPHVSNVGKGFSVTIDKRLSVEDALKGAFVAINNLYLKQANKLQIKFSDDGKTFASDGRFRRVEYTISSSDYGDIKYKGGTDEEDVNQVDANRISISFGDGATVDEIVDKIMKSSSEVKNDKEGKDGEKKFIYKINSVLDSEPNIIRINYQVNRFQVATSPYLALSKRLESGQPVPEDEIRTYNYIFTGKNTDILELDIKMNMGLAFFQSVQTTSHSTSQNAVRGVEGENELASGAMEAGEQTEDEKPRPKTPLFLGDKITDSTVRNSKNPVNSAQFQALLSKHAFLESTAVSLKVAGDTTLLGQMLVTDEINITSNNSGQTRGKSYLSGPIIFKINIQYPIDGTLKPFWYKGFYTLQRISHTFRDGLFTQNLIMYSLPVTTDISNEDPPPEKTGEEIKEQLDNPKPTNAEPPPSGNADQLTLADKKNASNKI